ncbi:unnamed protein product [Rotaria sp. Silwood2]|nr:unnamed protein product [Rotaria sp. Silwood2]CAF4611389.1 unnamed protein product [Rotaria sp. Silwood2]
MIDILYDDLLERPIATVRRIYDHFDLRWTKEFETAMDAWLRDNPQGKQGRNAYSLDEFDLTREDIDTRHIDYINLFLHSLSSKMADNN